VAGTDAPGSAEPSAPVEPTESPAVDETPDATEPAQPTATRRATATPRPAATPRPTATPSGATTVKVYLLADGRLVPVLRRIDATRAVGRAAMNELLEGPTAAEAAASPALTSAVPDGTTLLGLEVGDRVATVDLSRRFESGGGSASMFARLAQVTYTLTQFSTVDRVLFQLEGTPVTVFSSEGIVLTGPAVRADFQDLLPSVFVDRPAWGGSLESPARVTGIANVFEASFFIEVRDAEGRTLVREHAMATCGTGCWGTFDVTLRFSVPRRQAGSLVVYILSARDGSVEDLRSYPVTLRP
jgi:spore germination protein GerM